MVTILTKIPMALIRVMAVCAVAALVLANGVNRSALAAVDRSDTKRSAAALQLAPQDRVWFKKAFKFADKGDWRRAMQMARNAKHPLPRKVITWSYYRQPKAAVSFDTIADFIGDNPHWPAQRQLRKSAEEALWGNHKVSDAVVMAWFEKHPPQTGPGFARLAQAHFKHGDLAEGRIHLRRAWTRFTMSKRQARSIYRRHKKHLRAEDHWNRLDRLLWKGHRQSSLRMLSLVSKGQRRLAEARIALMTRSGNVDGKIAKVPKKLRSDPGLMYERARWRRRAKLDERAWEILTAPIATANGEENLQAAKRWWIERRYQSRKALSASKPRIAYKITKNHGQKPGTSGHAEAEWLAGWIAFRHLSEPKVAYRHFTGLYDVVKFPLSLSRASYWAARAANVIGDKALTEKWYAIAVRYPGTYYGQLAQESTGAQQVWSLPPEPKPDTATIRLFEARELVRAVRLLADLKQTGRARLIVYHLARTAKTPETQILAARLATAIDRNDVAVRTAKIAARSGTPGYRTGYPMMKLPHSRVDAALVHAITRQESEFNTRAVSRSGARGLMQLMPATAKAVSRRQKLRYRRAKLFDPNYNLRLGTAYLDGLLKRFGGSYIMAVAAYNAGPHRVKRWVREFGDPRKSGTDVVDWVESIPFTETRNYVQRVMENLQIFRVRLTNVNGGLALTQDLRRGRKGGAAPTL